MTCTLNLNQNHVLSEVARLVLRAQDGDRDAFGELVTRYEVSIFAMALRRLGNHAEAQELVQEVFVQALRKLDQLRDPSAFGSWLRSITARMALNRRVRNRPMFEAEPEMMENTCIDPETPVANVLAEERREQLHAGLDRLGELDRETLVAFYFEGRSLDEMSHVFDSPVGTIKRRLHVARKRLAKQLEEMIPA